LRYVGGTVVVDANPEREKARREVWERESERERERERDRKKGKERENKKKKSICAIVNKKS
jgi:hypothetical protein